MKYASFHPCEHGKSEVKTIMIMIKMTVNNNLVVSNMFLAPCDYKATSISKHHELAQPVVYESLDIAGEYHHGGGGPYKHVNATRQTRKEIKSLSEQNDNASVTKHTSLQYIILATNAILVSIRMLPVLVI